MQEWSRYRSPRRPLFGEYPRGGALRVVVPARGVPEREMRVLPAGQAHLLNEVLSVSADVIHPVLVDSEVCLEGFMFLQ